MVKNLIFRWILGCLAQILATNFFSWVLLLLDIRYCCKLSLYPILRKTYDPNSIKWKKTSFLKLYLKQSDSCEFCNNCIIYMTSNLSCIYCKFGDNLLLLSSQFLAVGSWTIARPDTNPTDTYLILQKMDIILQFQKSHRRIYEQHYFCKRKRKYRHN